MTDLPKPSSGDVPAAEEVGGGARPRDLRSVAEDISALPVGDRTDAFQFCNAVLRYLQQWVERREEGDERLSGTAVFVCAEDPQGDGERLGVPTPIKLFQRKLHYDLAGHLLISTPSVGTVYPAGLSSSDVSEAVDELVAWGLGERPAVLVDLAEQVALVCYSGTNTERPGQDLSYVEVDLRAPREQVTRDTVDAFLDHVHKVCLETPRASVHIWSDSASGVAVRAAELEIQGIIVMMADAMLKACKVTSEPKLSDSRADVLIYPIDESLGERTILELKVLRAKHFHSDPTQATRVSESDNRDGLIKGIDQVCDYRERFLMKNALLCAYDMRDDDDDALDQVVRPMANSREVLYRRYFMYRGAEQRRQSDPNSAFNEYQLLRRGKSN